MLRDCNSTPDAIDFCRAHGLASLLERAVVLAKKHFQPSDVTVYLGGDPDGDSQWLVIQCDVPGTVDTVLAAYRALKTEWLETGKENGVASFLTPPKRNNGAEMPPSGWIGMDGRRR